MDGQPADPHGVPARAAQCLIAGTILLARHRVVAFHPYYRGDYLRWLKSTPWTVRKPLPVGPVELVPQDALAVGGLMLLSLIQPQTESIEILDAFLFAHVLWIVGTFWKTGVPGFGYVGSCCWGSSPLWASPWIARGGPWRPPICWRSRAMACTGPLPLGDRRGRERPESRRAPGARVRPGVRLALRPAAPRRQGRCGPAASTPC